LQKSIEDFVKFPIATNYEKREPRLLVVSVDATEGIPVTFDSYEKGKDLDGKDIQKQFIVGILVKKKNNIISNSSNNQ
jgi:hypothetical protein